MNLFLLSWNPHECAKNHCDKHVVKMILELTQMLYTAWQINNNSDLPSCAPKCLSTGKYGYKKLSNPNHPMAKWVRESKWNYTFTIKLSIYLGFEYTYRYSKYHSCESHILWLSSNFPVFNCVTRTSIPQCMPDQYKVIDDPVKAYQNYYIGDKMGFAKWTKREQPSFIL